MKDPESGPAPPTEGASATKRGEGNSSRRGKSKRRGSNASLPVLSGVEGQSVKADPTGRSPNQDGSSPARKRKRRRKKNTPAAQPGVAPQTHAVEPVAQIVVAGGLPIAKAGKRRRKSRNKRGLQGRPLVPGKAPVPAGRVVEAGASAFRPSPHSGAVAASAVLPSAGSATGEPHPRPTVAAAPHIPDLYAALDLGTNNCRLLIAQPTKPGQFRVVDAFSRIVRLGEGLAASGRLSSDAMDRAVEALRICASKLAGREIRRMRLIATEACRAAENGEEFLRRVVSETGLDLEIIDRETEARLAVSGCSSLVGRETRSVVLFDIGGGSSEIAVIRIADNRSSRLANHITHWTSLPVGVVTLSERHGGRDVSPVIFEAMIGEVAAMLDRFDCPPLSDLGLADMAEDFHLIGTSGTVTTLAGVHLDLPRYDRRRVDGLWLTDDEVSAMQAKLLSWDYSSRAANPCIGPDRADLVLAGCAILEAIRRRWPSNRMRVADRGLREGLLTDMMADDGVWRRHRPRRPNGPRER
ncbi:exopolyphosphatase [Agrobacterium sp. a22-2]|uniref:Ppx/GppA phosphatase family protein n=1 Tax=Agrobacterium sp. a22-2 TaxID=2283840 RepID=UPI001444F35C|nr:exopolyphosphatase [Agrobacterium sp. a22-2]